MYRAWCRGLSRWPQGDVILVHYTSKIWSDSLEAGQQTDEDKVISHALQHFCDDSGTTSDRWTEEVQDGHGETKSWKQLSEGNAKLCWSSSDLHETLINKEQTYQDDGPRPPQQM